MGDRVRKNAAFTAHDEAMLAELLGRKRATQAAREAERKRVDRFCMKHLGVGYTDAVKAVEAYRSRMGCDAPETEVTSGPRYEHNNDAGVVGAMPLPP